MDIIQLPLDFYSPQLCQCGCGLPAPIAKQTKSARGEFKGHPIRFVRGHNLRSKLTLEERRERDRMVFRKWQAKNLQRRREERKARDAKRRPILRKQYRAWVARHPESAEHRKAQYREWYADNSDTAKKRAWEWSKRHPEVGRRAAANRRARTLAAPGKATAKEVAARWAMWGGLCWLCGKTATCTDHVIPLSKGGTNWPANLRPACQSCNSSKGAKRVHVVSN